MSVRHPNITAWQRDHDGSYSGELCGFTLRVRWSPNTREQRGNFYWQVSRSAEKARRSVEHFEELEAAMADAEEYAREEAARRAPPRAPAPPH